MTTNIDPNIRLIRQSQLIAPELQDAIVLIAGAGMLGSWTALGLARLAHEVHVWDFDQVEDVNAGTQAYTGNHFGMTKVGALETLTQGLPLHPHEGLFPVEASYEDLGLSLTFRKFEDDDEDTTRKVVVVSAVDSFKARAEVAAWARYHGADLFVDTRAHGEVAVHCIVPPEELEKYIGGLPTDEEAPPAMCGAEGSVHAAMMVAARTIAGVSSYFKGVPVPLIQSEHVGNNEVMHREMIVL